MCRMFGDSTRQYSVQMPQLLTQRTLEWLEAYLDACAPYDSRNHEHRFDRLLQHMDRVRHDMEVRDDGYKQRCPSRRVP